MARAKVIGYVVMCGRRPLVLVKDTDRRLARAGVLYFGSPLRATLFGTKRQAKAAIRRTNEDRVAYNGLTFNEEFGETSVVPVVGMP